MSVALCRDMCLREHYKVMFVISLLGLHMLDINKHVGEYSEQQLDGQAEFRCKFHDERQYVFMKQQTHLDIQRSNCSVICIVWNGNERRNYEWNMWWKGWLARHTKMPSTPKDWAAEICIQLGIIQRAAFCLQVVASFSFIAESQKRSVYISCHNLLWKQTL